MLEKRKTPISGYETASGRAVAPHAANRNVKTTKNQQDSEGLKKKSDEASRSLTQIQEEQNKPEQVAPDTYLAWKQRSASRLLRRFLKSSPKLKKAMAPGLAAEINLMATQENGKEKSPLLKAAKVLGKTFGRKGLSVPKDWNEVCDEMVKEFTRRG